MGKVYLVGAGPGSAELITMRGARLLGQADIVFYDALVSNEVLALAPGAEKISVGKRCGKISIDQRFINRRLVEAASHYNVVVRLKGGDPMLFGRAQEEIEALQAADIQFEIIPGVTTALAAASELGISLTRRGMSRSVSFSTPRIGSEEKTNNDWLDNASATDTAVLYMASQQLNQVVAALIAKGIPDNRPLAIVENVSLPNSRKFFTTLGELRAGLPWKPTGPTIILIGEVFTDTIAHAGKNLQSVREIKQATTRKTA